jgi:hypothetical protein
MNAVCIVVDGLRCGFLGCYGNTWVQTPAIDRLAAQGFVFDQALIESPQWEDAYRSYWLGESGFAPREKELASLPHTLAMAGVNTALVTDEAELAVHPLAASLGEIVQLPINRQQAAASIDETQYAAVFTAAADRIDSAQEPFLLWVHDSCARNARRVGCAAISATSFG